VLLTKYPAAQKKCFKKINDPAEEAFYSGNPFIKIKKDPEWEVFKSFTDISPSFLDSFEVLKRNIQNEKIIVYTDRSEIKGYAIYQPESGRISQLAVHKEYRRKGIGSAIVEYLNSKNIVLTAMNVNAEAKHIVDFLLKNQFINEIDQYEMQLEIS
jgi:ribosomal protein S18 acetylase RimI-like enzyme